MDENVVRKDYLLNRFVIIAAGRTKRPYDSRVVQPKGRASDSKCPFCPRNEPETPPELFRMGTKKKWSVRVFANKFAAFSPRFVHSQKQPSGLVEFPAMGVHEVVIDTPLHNKTFWDFSQQQMLDTLETIGQRQREILLHSSAKHVFAAKNFGLECGASLQHSHWQLFCPPFEPTLISQEKKAAGAFFKKTGKNVFDWIVKTEQKSKRKWLSNKEWICFCPFASIWPYEFWIVPKKQVSSFRSLSSQQKRTLASIVLKAFSQLKRLFGILPFNLVFHETMAPSKHYRFHIEVYPNVHKIWAGLEKGAGIFINEVPPEQAAKVLRGG